MIVPAARPAPTKATRRWALLRQQIVAVAALADVFFVIGYPPTERATDSMISIAARAGTVGLCLVDRAQLPDPKWLLHGSGNRTRFIVVAAASDLANPEWRR